MKLIFAVFFFFLLTLRTLIFENFANFGLAKINAREIFGKGISQKLILAKFLEKKQITKIHGREIQKKRLVETKFLQKNNYFNVRNFRGKKFS